MKSKFERPYSFVAIELFENKNELYMYLKKVKLILQCLEIYEIHTKSSNCHLICTQFSL